MSLYPQINVVHTGQEIRFPLKQVETVTESYNWSKCSIKGSWLLSTNGHIYNTVPASEAEGTLQKMG